MTSSWSWADRRRTTRAGRRVRGLALLLVLVLPAGALAAARTSDPLVERQHHLERVGAFDAWATARGQGVTVAILDTGVAADHEDLRGRTLAGRDFVDPGTPPDDPNGHGTLVAGIVAAATDNGVGVAGTAPAARLLPVRVLDADGGGRSADVAAGIRWAVDAGAGVVNLSLAEVPGATGALVGLLITPEVEQAIRDAARRGAVVVASAGNDGERTTPYARDLPALIVGATDRRDAIWEHSNRDERTLFAPGVGIVSTWSRPPGYGEADGTSFATPIVAAGAALLRGLGLDADRARRRLVASAVPVGAGVGRVDLAAAVRGLASAPSDGASSAAPPPGGSPGPAPAPAATDGAEESPPAGPTSAAPPADGQPSAGGGGAPGPSAGATAGDPGERGGGEPPPVGGGDGRPSGGSAVDGAGGAPTGSDGQVRHDPAGPAHGVSQGALPVVRPLAPGEPAARRPLVPAALAALLVIVSAAAAGAFVLARRRGAS